MPPGRAPRLVITAALLAAAFAVASSPGATRVPVRARAPTVAGCRVLPAANAFNQRVDRLPVAAGSSSVLARIGLSAPVHPDFGTVYNGAPNGIPFTVVSDPVRRLPVHFTYASESDGHRYPLPRGVAIEGGSHAGGDRHVLVLDRTTCTDYELFAARPHKGYWTAGSGAIFHLGSDHLRPAGWTSADAAGLPILPGLARYSEVAAGAIDHALRFTAPCTGPRYVYPARHIASSCPPCPRHPASLNGTAYESSGCAGPSAPPMGLRVRLKASVNISSLPYQARVVAQALKRYGLILADNGSPWYISGAPDPRWNDSAMHELGRLRGSDFQIVNTRSLPHPGL
ncbi:MAG: hypothetical protein ACR2GZ_11165 [Solirubrobacteraceae bacterium]